MYPHLLDRGSCLFRREKFDEAFGCLGILSTFHHSGGEHLDKLKIGGDRSHEIDALNGQDFTYRQKGLFIGPTSAGLRRCFTEYICHLGFEQVEKRGGLFLFLDVKEEVLQLADPILCSNSIGQ